MNKKLKTSPFKLLAFLVILVLTVSVFTSTADAAGGYITQDGVIYKVYTTGISLKRLYVYDVDVEKSGTFEIPEAVDGIAVKKIYQGAFYGCNKITQITIPSSVNTIGDSAFKLCTALESVAFGSGVKEIGESLFNGCVNLKKITVAQGNEHFSADENGILYNIDKTALLVCPSVVAGESYSVPEGIVTIGKTAFSSCHKLEEINLPSTVIDIGTNAFYGTAFYANAENWENGLLYAGNHLVNSITNGEVIIKDGTIAIAENAFARSNAKKVSFPDSLRYVGNMAFYKSDVTAVDFNKVEVIGDQAFFECDELKIIDLPSTVRKIGQGAFAQTEPEIIVMRLGVEHMYTDSFSLKATANCEGYFEGSRQQFDAIEKTGLSSVNFTYYNHPEAAHSYTKYTTNREETYFEEGSEIAYCDYGCGKSKVRYLPRSVFLGTVQNLKAKHTGVELVLTWDAVKDATGYGVYEKIDGKWKHIRNVSTTTYKITGLPGNPKHMYAVRAYACSEVDGWGVTVPAPGYATVEITLGKIAAPTNLTFKSNLSAIKLSWTAVSGVDGYKVYEKTDKGWKSLGNTVKTSVTFTGMKAGTRRTFAVKAGKIIDGKVVWSVPCAVIETMTWIEAPENIEVKQNTNAIRISWDSCEGAEGYNVYRKNGDKWVEYITGSNKYTFTSLKPGMKYTLAVSPYAMVDNRSVNNDVIRKVTGEHIIFTTATAPLAPKTTAVSLVTGQIKLSWEAFKNVDGYQVYYKVNGGEYKYYKTYTTAQALTFNNLNGGDTYTFAVRAGLKTSFGAVWGGYEEKTVTLAKRMDSYINAIKKEDFYVVTSYDGSSYDTVARKDGKICFLTEHDDGIFFRLIYNPKTNVCWEIDDKEKKYSTYTYKPGEYPEEAFYRTIGYWSDMKFEKSAKEKIDGKTYFVETYSINGLKVSFYFDGATLVKQNVTAGGEGVPTYYSEFTRNVPDSIFAIPGDYTEVNPA